MTVEKLIEQLKTMPKDATVWHLWDGELRTEINVVYLSKAGEVVTADFNEICYTGENRPVNAPDESEEPYWKTEDRPTN